MGGLVPASAGGVAVEDRVVSISSKSATLGETRSEDCGERLERSQTPTGEVVRVVQKDEKQEKEGGRKDLALPHRNTLLDQAIVAWGD